MSRSQVLRTLGGLGVAALAAAGLSACVGTPGGIQAADSWTVLTYEIADTNLEPFMMQDIEEMGQVGSRPGFNLISFVDRAEGYSDSSVLGLPNWTGAKWLQVEPGGTANVLRDFGPVDTGDPALLADFIRESILKFPAAHYALIISDHGASWPGVGGSYTWQPTADNGLYAQLDSLKYSLDPLPSGTQLYIELWVVDFGGNSDYVNAVVTVP